MFEFEGFPLALRAATEMAARIVLKRDENGKVYFLIANSMTNVPLLKAVEIVQGVEQLSEDPADTRPTATVTVKFDCVFNAPRTTCVVNMRRSGTEWKGGNLWRIDSVRFEQFVIVATETFDTRSVEFTSQELLTKGFRVHPRVG